MIPLIRQFFHDLLWSRDRARVWFRTLLAWLGATGMQAVGVPFEVLAMWTAREWALRFVVSGIMAAALAIRAGEMNPKPQPQAEEPAAP